MPVPLIGVGRDLSRVKVNPSSTRNVIAGAKATRVLVPETTQKVLLTENATKQPTVVGEKWLAALDYQNPLINNKTYQFHPSTKTRI